MYGAIFSAELRRCCRLASVGPGKKHIVSVGRWSRLRLYSVSFGEIDFWSRVHCFARHGENKNLSVSVALDHAKMYLFGCKDPLARVIQKDCGFLQNESFFRKHIIHFLKPGDNSVIVNFCRGDVEIARSSMCLSRFKNLFGDSVY